MSGARLEHVHYILWLKSCPRPCHSNEQTPIHICPDSHRICVSQLFLAFSVKLVPGFLYMTFVFKIVSWNYNDPLRAVLKCCECSILVQTIFFGMGANLHALHALEPVPELLSDGIWKLILSCSGLWCQDSSQMASGGSF